MHRFSQLGEQRLPPAHQREPNTAASMTLVPTCCRKYTQLKLRCSTPQNTHSTPPMTTHNSNMSGRLGERQASHNRIASDGASDTATPRDGQVVAAEVAAL